MRILVLGGDGYLGWPQAMYLSDQGHDVHVVDSLVRRHFDLEHGIDSLLPIASLHRRTVRWQEITGRAIGIHVTDITDYAALSLVFAEFRPEAVVHFGEQRSAPFSMIDREHAVFTQTNNVVGTLNVLYCLAEYTPEPP
ncbi:MAG: NAD-dependent epimerase/dehydratase family protein [Nocardioides sp.]